MSLTDLITKRDEWIKALDAVKKGQNYSIDGMSVTRVNVEEIRKTIGQYNRQIANIERGATVGRAVWR